MSWFNKIPLLSQIKSAAQAISGDTKGARQTQEEFSKQTPVVSQIRSGIEAVSGNPEAARKTQQEFYNETIKNTPIASQIISAGYAISGNTEEAKRIQQNFLNETIKGLQEYLAWQTGTYLKQFNKLDTSNSLKDRSSWMSQFQQRRLRELLLPGSHDSTAYTFLNAAGATIWAQTQKISIKDQLLGGIRYLDIRIHKDKHDIRETYGKWSITSPGGIPGRVNITNISSAICCSHTFITIPFEEVLKDIYEFVSNHGTEIIVLAVQDDGGRTQMDEAKQLAMQILNRYMTDSVNGEETLSDLVKNNKNVLYTEYKLCGGLNIISSYDTTKSADPIKVVDNCIDFTRSISRGSGELILMALEATPMEGADGDKINYILTEISSFGGGLEELARYSNYKVLNTYLKNQGALDSSNVIMTDYVNDQIIKETILSNQ